MQRLLHRLASLRAATAFPGRVRVVAQAGFAAAAGADSEWHGADAGETIAAAAGVALAESARGGTVVALVGADAGVGPALATAGALAAPLLVALADASEAGLAPYRAAGWAVAETDSALPPARPTVLRVSAVPGPAAAPVAREWPPVRLPALRGWQREIWSDPLAALAGLTTREPRLRLVHAQSPWASAPVSASTLIAAAAHAAEGRRMVWRLPAGSDLLGWLPALRALGRHRLPVTLLIDPDDTPALAHWRALPGWWLAAPGDRGETVAVLARALASEDALALVLPTAAAELPPWPNGDEHEAGSGRWLARAETARATIVCSAASSAAGLAARDALSALALEVAIFQCTSLHPLPLGDLAAAAGRGPLVVVDPGAGSSGLAAALAADLPGCGGHRVAAWRGVAPAAADIAAAVRGALGALGT